MAPKGIWHAHGAEIQELIEQGRSMAEIARRFGVCRERIRAVLVSHSLVTRARMLNQKEVAALLGCCRAFLTGLEQKGLISPIHSGLKHGPVYYPEGEINKIRAIMGKKGGGSYTMITQEGSLVSFLKEVMRRRKCLPVHLASALGLSHATVSRWLNGKDVPGIRSCQRLAEYSGVPLNKVLSIAGHLPPIADRKPADLPQFRDYAHLMYPDELDDDVITVVEDLIERRRRKGIEQRVK